eukprot:scaffold40430_cov65-Phaeocystis_antarctica.AAC.12
MGCEMRPACTPPRENETHTDYSSSITTTPKAARRVTVRSAGAAVKRDPVKREGTEHMATSRHRSQAVAISRCAPGPRVHKVVERAGLLALLGGGCHVGGYQGVEELEEGPEGRVAAARVVGPLHLCHRVGLHASALQRGAEEVLVAGARSLELLLQHT